MICRFLYAKKKEGCRIRSTIFDNLPFYIQFTILSRMAPEQKPVRDLSLTVLLN